VSSSSPAPHPHSYHNAPRIRTNPPTPSVRPSNRVLILHLPHLQSALCIHSSHTSLRRMHLAHSEAHLRTASRTVHCFSLSSVQPPYRIHPVFASLSDARPSRVFAVLVLRAVSSPFVCSYHNLINLLRCILLLIFFRNFSSFRSVSFGRPVIALSFAHFWLIRMRTIDWVVPNTPGRVAVSLTLAWSQAAARIIEDTNQRKTTSRVCGCPETQS